jgi:hypothetical protein
MIITKGTSFPTIQEAMKTMFNRDTGSGQKPGYYVYQSGWAVWFPHAARPGANGRLAPPPGKHWINILSANEAEIIEMNTLPGSAGCVPSKGGAFPPRRFHQRRRGPLRLCGRL